MRAAHVDLLMGWGIVLIVAAQPGIITAALGAIVILQLFRIQNLYRWRDIATIATTTVEEMIATTEGLVTSSKGMVESAERLAALVEAEYPEINETQSKVH